MGKLQQQMFTVPPALLKFVGPEVPRAMRLTAARGTLPLPPKDLVNALFYLARDQDPEIKSLAEQSLLKLPQGVLNAVLSDPNTHPLILDFYARNLPQDSELQEVIALNRATDDETIIFQASLTNKKLIDIISNNQIRLLRGPEIVDALAENPLTSPAMIDRIMKFLELEAKKKPEEKKPQVGEGMEVEIEEVIEEEEEAEEIGPVTVEGEEVENAWTRFSYTQDLLEEKEYESKEEQEEEEQNLYRKIQNMKVSEKIKLALVGNMQARSILIRDSNKLVATAVLKSPRITESEIESITRSRSVSEEVIRQIAHNKEWTRNYQIKLNLVNNSKTPVSDALKFLNHLRDKDLQQVARSRNIPQPVVIAARKLLQTRQEKFKPKRPGKH